MKPGSKLICINDQFDEAAKLCLSVFPRKGAVYTVTEIIPDPLRELPPGLVLEGLTNPMGQVPCRNGLVLIQYSFRADRFVPQAKKEEPWGGSFFHLKYPLGIPSIEN